jgi:hypothetical protein
VTEVLFIVFLVSCFGYAIYACIKGVVLETAMRKNILSMLDAGFCIEKGKKHIFRSGKQYKIYHFDKDSNLIDSKEDTFSNGDEAVGKFLKLCGLSK